MKNLFKNLLPYKLTSVIILLLVLGQAFCDMNLPQYTQNMVDVGIQNKGIEHILPAKITVDEFISLCDVADNTEKAILKKEYSLDESNENVYLLNPNLSKEQLNKFDEDLIEPVIMRYTGNSIDEYIDEDAQAAGLDDGKETVKSMGIAYAIKCDKSAGIDIDKVQQEYMWDCGIKMLLMALAILLLTAITSFLAAKVGAGIGKDLRSKLFKNVMSFSSAEIEQFQTSSLITRATNDIQQVQITCTVLLRLVLYAPCISVWAIIKIVQMKSHMNYIIVCSVIIVALFFLSFYLIVRSKFKIMQRLIDGLNSVSREMITGIQVVRAFGREKTEEERFDDANHKLYMNQLFVTRMMTILTPIVMIATYGLVIYIIWVSSYRIDDGIIQVGAMTAFISYTIEFLFSFGLLAGVALFLPRAAVAADRIYEVIDTESSIKNNEDAIDIENIDGVVSFNNVSFRYPDAEENVLTDISFTAKPGETTAIIGSTGCGKTTIVNLIPRFYDVTKGTITIDGTDIRNITLHSLRESIGYVSQKGMLFSGTIDSNIRFGRPEAAEEEIKSAVELAQATEFIEAKEEKYESFIAQGGSNVSGGQKQRLSIARAMIKKSPILIFDDSFSALDMKTDAKLRKALNKDALDATKIIVAQRVGTILHADQIIVLEDGKIVGMGKHNELMKNCEIYREIAESQLSEKELKMQE